MQFRNRATTPGRRRRVGVRRDGPNKRSGRVIIVEPVRDSLDRTLAACHHYRMRILDWYVRRTCPSDTGEPSTYSRPEPCPYRMHPFL